MPRSAAKSKKSASGLGNIRKKTVTRNGQQYTYWEARYTEGYDPGTGKQIQRSISGKTQKEVAQKLKAITASLDAGTYSAPCKMTVGEWLDIWAQEYLVGVKPRTVDSYKTTVKTHLKVGLGAIRLEALTTHTIQEFYNSLSAGKRGKEPLSPKTVKNTHGVLHKALQQAVANGYIRFNPAEACVLPKITKKEFQPLDEDQISAFLREIKGHRYESLFITTLFTGMREGEVLGLLWDCVDLEKGKILINKQLQKVRGSNGEYSLVPTKNGKGRSITLAPFVVNLLRSVKHKQSLCLFSKGLTSAPSFVFTDELGNHLKHQTVYLDFKKVMAQIGAPDVRFHDLRHSYAVASIRSGDDIKTVQENLGHATAAFTLDVYGHVTEKMKLESANRMEQFIRSVCA